MISKWFTNPRIEMAPSDYDKYIEDARGRWESSFNNGDYGFPEEEDDE
jgi:hypothetical protein